MRKLVRLMLFTLIIFSITIFTSCENSVSKKDDHNQELIDIKMYELEQALIYYNNSTNFTVDTCLIEVSDTYDYGELSNTDIKSITRLYKEANDRQYLSIKDGHIVEDYYSELLDNNYITYYVDYSTFYGNYTVVDYVDYYSLRKESITFGLDIQLSDFTYDVDNDKFIGNVDALSAKMYDYLTDPKNEYIPNNLEINIIKFNIECLNNVFKQFEIEYIINYESMVQPIEGGLVTKSTHQTVVSIFEFDNTEIARPKPLE